MARPASFIVSGRVSVFSIAVLAAALCAGSTSLSSQGGVDLQPGFPVNVGASFRASPALADIDGDGLDDIVAADQNGYVHVRRHDGSSVLGWPRYAGGGAIFGHPAVGDLDADGHPEVVVTTFGLQLVVAFHHTGELVAGYPYDASALPNDHFQNGPALANLDSDPGLEIVAVTARGWAVALDSPGAALLPGWPKNLVSFESSGPVLADLDRLGLPEILIRVTNTLHVLSVQGQSFPGWPRFLPSGVLPESLAAPAVADLDGDSTAEVVVIERGGLSTFAANGLPLRHESFLPGFHHSGQGGMALANLRGDLALEIVLAGDGGLLFLVDSELAVLPGWPVLLDGEVAWAPIIADLTGDGQQEIIAATDAGTVWILRPDGTDRFPFPPTVPGGIGAAPAVGDLDGDGTPELVVGTFSGALYVFDFAGPWDPFWAEWPQAQADARRSGTHRSMADLADADGDADPDIFDCAPNDPAIHHRAVELCNGLDEDCSGTADDLDADFDGFDLCADDCDDASDVTYPGAPQLCDGINNDCGDPAWPAVPPGEADNDADTWRICGGDCDDARPEVSPGGTQICGDGLNNDCLDPAWPALTATNDGDDDGDAFTPCEGDCDDSLSAVRPGAPQICGDDVNNDCLDPAWPDDFSEWDEDADGLRGCEGDCDDTRATVRPGAPEICDDRDNDCDGVLPAAEQDGDLDSFATCEGECDDANGSIYPGAPAICDGLNNDCGHPMWPAVAGTNESDDDGDAFTECAGDCVDSNAAIYTGAPQICGDGVNNDCLNPAWPIEPTDMDQDGDGQRGCEGDCDDTRASVRLGAPEICDDRDNDCDGSLRLDELDTDADGYALCEGDCDDTRSTLRPGGAQICDGLNNNCLHAGWPALTGTNESDDDGDTISECAGDCADSAGAVYPGAPQVCGDGINNDCQHPTWPIDATEIDDDSDGLSECLGDCDDNRTLVYPGAPQVCDGVNNDCLDPAWPALPSAEADLDGDGRSSCGFDCDDTNAAILPGGPQICDGFNNECAHLQWPSLAGTNEGDDDGDSFTECGGDCDDTRALVFPGATQVCDGVNNDCAAPGWPSPTGTVDADDDADGWSACAGDCDPARITVYPGAPQICADGLNNDCLHPTWPVDTTGTDDDGDGQWECAVANDCDDTNPTVFTFAPQVCGDGLNNDCRHLSWPALYGTNEVDDDGDGFSECALSPDCDDTEAVVWATPGEVSDVTVSLEVGTWITTLIWPAPAAPGSQALTYDVLRSQTPWNFLGDAVCLETNDSDLTVDDPSQVRPILDVYFYLIRPKNGCPGAAGSGIIGRDSEGGVIPGRNCP